MIANRGFAPFTYDDLVGISDWRERLHWPIRQTDIAAIGERVPSAVLAAAADFDDPFERQVATVAAGLFGGGFMSLVEATLVAQFSTGIGLEIRGGPPEMPFLSEGLEDFRVLEKSRPVWSQVGAVGADARAGEDGHLDRLI